ncbi:unnamed protein product [Amoebophrya sp. A25]|nr:unnamed protein product [Amoebophrya sp. A25]|eukprot:GSA25T00012491001.1
MRMRGADGSAGSMVISLMRVSCYRFYFPLTYLSSYSLFFHDVCNCILASGSLRCRKKGRLSRQKCTDKTGAT